MNSQRLVVARLGLDQRELVLAEASLVAARRDSGEVDWEVVAHCLEPPEVAPGVHDVTIEVLDTGGPEPRLVRMEGSALFVRAVDDSVVLRGASTLSGLVW